MKRVIEWAIAGWACAGLVASPVMAAAERPAAFCGKVVALTESGCIGVVAGTAKYELGAADPKLQVGTLIAGSGTPTNVVTTCQEAIHLTKVAWNVVASCPTVDHRPTGY